MDSVLCPPLGMGDFDGVDGEVEDTNGGWIISSVGSPLRDIMAALSILEEGIFGDGLLGTSEVPAVHCKLWW